MRQTLQNQKNNAASSVDTHENFDRKAAAEVDVGECAEGAKTNAEIQETHDSPKGAPKGPKTLRGELLL